MFGFVCCATAGVYAIVAAVKQAATKPSHLIFICVIGALLFFSIMRVQLLREFNEIEQAIAARNADRDRFGKRPGPRIGC
jgi:hypothetical protein